MKEMELNSTLYKRWLKGSSVIGLGFGDENE